MIILTKVRNPYINVRSNKTASKKEQITTKTKPSILFFSYLKMFAILFLMFVFGTEMFSLLQVKLKSGKLFMYEA